jgi:hypothetical protein
LELAIIGWTPGMKPVETYFRSLHYSYAAGAGTARTAYNSSLANLLNDLGRGLKPKVRCLLDLKEISPGLPDGGFFTVNQFPRAARATGLPGGPPNRGAIEVIEAGHDLYTMAYSQPVEKYLKKYRYLLVTNYWGFILMGLDGDGQPVELESYSLAEGEADFWSQIAQPRYMANIHGDRLAEFLKRAMLYAVPLDNPKNVAFFLASYARELNSRLENVPLLATETTQATALLQALDRIRTAFETTLGLPLEGAKGNRLFCSLLVHTIFCAVFSAWVLWHYEAAEQPERFDWRLTHWHLRLPLLHALLRQLAKPGQAAGSELNLEEILDLVGDTLNRINRDDFFANFEAEQVIQSFYQPFLQAFSPKLQKAFGIWYPPSEVVKYIVARIDQLLREEFGIPDGLANEQVYILDPCCGAGAYLIEALKRIAATLREKGDETIVGYYVKKAALKRVFGLEREPASFVMAHLHLGLLLHRLDMPFATTERPAIYLANGLLDGSGETDETLPELQAEQDAANQVKQSHKILVILGNPPHDGSYLRFFQMAEQKIAAQEQGIICYLSNHAWLDALALAGMRERYLELFDQIWVDALNGDKYRTGNLTPTGEPDPNVFSTKSNRQGTRAGAAVTLLVRKQPHLKIDKIKFRNLWGKTKLSQLLATPPSEVIYQELAARSEPGFSFMPPQDLSDYPTWPLLSDLFPVSFPALPTPAPEAAALPSKQHDLNGNELIKYAYRPFDLRRIRPPFETGILNEKQRDLIAVSQANNLLLICAKKMEAGQEGAPFYTTGLLADKYLIRSGGVCFPITLKGLAAAQHPLFDQLPQRVTANLSPEAHKYLLNIGIPDPDADEESACLVGHHALAVGYAPEYLLENEGGLRQDWPRIPLPNNKITIRKSALLGQKIAALLNIETPVPGVTTGSIRPELKSVAILTRINAEDLNPELDLVMTTAWADNRRNGAARIEGQLVERDYTPPERAAIEKGAAALGMTLDQLDDYFGATTCDIYLNESVYWANIPRRAWEYRIGGYPVIQHWLSYRDRQSLGRALTSKEAQELSGIARRLTALVLMEAALDANYQAVKQASYTWPIGKKENQGNR